MSKPNLVRVASDTWVNEGEIVSIYVESYPEVDSCPTGKFWVVNLKENSKVLIPFGSDSLLREYIGIEQDAPPTTG